MRSLCFILFAVFAAEAKDLHWAYELPTKPNLPLVKHADWARNGIDFFCLSRMESRGHTPKERESSARLIRRVFLDLIGIPPPIEKVDSFLLDPSDQHLEKIVDELLSSNRFGEKWALGWLDLARYADSDGYQRDGFRNVWPYRDWVIRAFNSDMPFDQFTIEQLAGDLLPEATKDQIIATGFHRGPILNLEAGTDPEEDRVKQVVDRVNTTSTVWLGTSMECTQCHDHKHDPFSIRDYYSMFAFFNNTPIEGKRRPGGNDASMDYAGSDINVPVPTDELNKRDEAENKAREGEKNYVTKVEELCESFSDDQLNELVEKHPKEVDLIRKSKIDFKEALKISKALFQKGKYSKSLNELQKQIANNNNRSKGGTFQIGYTSRVMREMGKKRGTHIMLRGDFRNIGKKVSADTPESLHLFRKEYPRNRLGLAQWLVSQENPLTARVTVNRIWAELFGRGIVTTIEDFGTNGAFPTHPKLLDWLAVTFQSEDSWSLKKTIKRIVLSSVYLQSFTVSKLERDKDPDNSYYARGPSLRLPAELIRDNALFISGLLSTKMYGMPVRPFQPANFWRVIGEVDNKYYASENEDLYRRGIYTIWRRSAHYPSFANFDAPSRGACKVIRKSSNTPLQALTLLNDPVYVEIAKAFADRIKKETAKLNAPKQLEYAFRLALSRYPNGAEITALKNIYFTALDTEGSAESAWFEIANTLLNLHGTITK